MPLIKPDSSVCISSNGGRPGPPQLRARPLYILVCIRLVSTTVVLRSSLVVVSVNHQIMVWKLYDILQNYPEVQVCSPNSLCKTKEIIELATGSAQLSAGRPALGGGDRSQLSGTGRVVFIT